MNYILLHKSYGAVSMGMVQDKMEEEITLVAKRNHADWQYREKGGKWTRLDSVLNIVNIPQHKIINWGNYIFPGYTFSLNQPSGIANASNKAYSRRILQNFGVKVPRTYFGPSLDKMRPANYPLILRPKFHHGGQHFTLLNSFEELVSKLWGTDSADWYVSEIFQKTAEFRLHVAHGKVLFVNEKPLVEGEIRANQAVNHESWRVLKWSEFHRGMCREAILAVELLGLDYGAVDMMYNSKYDSWAICEVNTSPSINTPYSSEKYAAYFDWVIRHDFPEHFPAEQESYVFYSKLLRD